MTDDLREALEALGPLRERLANTLGCDAEGITVANAAGAREVWSWTCYAMITGVRDAPLVTLRAALAREFPSVIE